MSSIRLAVTTGDPAGIGPEIVDAVLAESTDGVELVRVGADAASPGRPSADTGRAALAAIDEACDLALNGTVLGIVTAPVSKQHVAATGVPFPGHTEYIAGRCGVRRPVMLFAGDRFRVALATRHVPMKRLLQALTAELISDTLRRTAEALRNFFGVQEPRIAVCGLNPHAGEGGTLGREEGEIIEPGMEMSGVPCDGPFAADTIFRREGFDAILAMYHDQALPVVKTLDPSAVNVTLGLPFPRTSPDHGTAFDIAGAGRADAEPLRRAVALAAEMVRAKAALL